MQRADSITVDTIPDLDLALLAKTVEDLKWYAGGLPGKVPTRKAELVEMLARALKDPAEVRRLWERLTPAQQRVVAEVVHNLGGRYDAGVLRAQYPGSKPPKDGDQSYASYAERQKAATPYDLFFFRFAGFGTCVPTDLGALLRTFVPRPEPLRLPGQDEPPAVAGPIAHGEPVPEVTVTDAERAAFHDLGATLYLIQQGKVTVSATTKLPTLASVRHLRERLLIGDYFADDYGRAEDAIRPLALIVLAQAARWAAPTGPNGTRLELTRDGQALLVESLRPHHVRETWGRWLKSDLLDELSRIREIKGQQSRRTHLTKPAGRREKLAAALRACPVGRWIELDEFFRYVRAESLSPAIERGETTGLHIVDPEYGWLGYSEMDYWDIVVGSYLRALLFEYAATLGIIEIAYTRPEESPHAFEAVWGLDLLEYLSRYDGLLGFRLTDLGAYVLGLADEYAPPAPPADQGQPPLRVLPNLDVVVVDATRITPTERAFLERIGTAQGEHVYRLSRERVLEAVQHGLDVRQVLDFLAGKSGLSEAELPQTVRVFFEDLARRLGALREAGRAVILESDDPIVLTELAHTAPLQAMVRLATVEGRTVLLIPHEQEAAARRQLRKLGYLPRKG